MTLKYYLDSLASTSESDDIDQTGLSPSSGIGAFHAVSDQVRYNDKVFLKEGYNLGESLQLRIQNEELNTGFDLSEIQVNIFPRHKKTYKNVGG